MRERGFSLVEALVAVAIVLVMAAVAFPAFRAHFAEAHLVGAGQQFKSQFRLACSTAVRSGVYTAIRFERRDDGTVWYAVYADGNDNGVRSADIPRAGPTRSSRVPSRSRAAPPACGSASTRGIPALPPERGTAVGRPRALRPLRHPVLLAPRDGDARARSTSPATRPRPRCASPAAAPACA